MAIRKSDFTNSKAKKPSYERTSKMRKYDTTFDSNVGKIRSTYIKRIDDAISADGRDIIFTVEPGYEYRTDLISVKFYGTSKYDWVIEDANNIRDPIKDIVAGKKLIIPDKSKIYSAT